MKKENPFHFEKYLPIFIKTKFELFMNKSGVYILPDILKSSPYPIFSILKNFPRILGVPIKTPYKHIIEHTCPKFSLPVEPYFL